MDRLGNQGEFLHGLATVGNTGERNLEVLALERERLLVERPTNDLHRLLEDLTIVEIGSGLVWVVHRADRHALVVEVQHLAWHRATADAEHAAPARQVVQGGEVFSEAQRVPLRHDVEHRAEAQLGRLRSDPGGDQQPVGDDLVALVLEVVFGRPERVEAEAFCLLGRIDVVERRLPTFVVRVATIHGSRCPCASVVHFDATKEEGSEFEVRSFGHGG